MDSDDFDIDDTFNDVRNDLNLDDETAEDALNTFRRISANYSLEGEKRDWIACALYSSCRKCVTQTMGKSNKIEGNLVSLTRILRSCNISLVRFFNKMKNWTEMANLSMDMRNKLDQLERNFNVTTVIFKKFKPIFEDIFKCPVEMPCRFIPKNRKQIRKQALNSLDIYNFCWTLFVYIKSKYSQISDDLVNSYHLLLVCLDYCFSSVLSFDNYQDIVNTNFYDMLTTELKSDPRSHNNDNRVSIIDILCNKWKGIPIEVKQIKKHWFKPFLKALVEKEEIRKRGNGIIDSDVIDFNFKYLKREYESFVLTIGDFDECVFLNETASEELGTSELRSNFSDLDNNLSSRATPGANQSNHFMPMTPLSSKQYLATRTPVNKSIPLTPITSGIASISRLQSILIGHNNEPSVDLGNLFDKCKNNPRERIASMVKTMGDIFLAAYSKESSPQSLIRNTNEIQYIVTDQFPKSRLDFAIKFFYNVLEKILKGELRRNQRLPNSQIADSLARIIDKDIFLRSLFACSLEIVLYMYNPYNRVFPWILNIFNDYSDLKIHSFYFYKVIEPIIRDEEGLSREIVKHLNTIEEKILDSLAWTTDSPIWALLNSKEPAPTYADVALRLDSNYLNSPVTKSEFNNSIPNAYSNKCSAKRQLTFGSNEAPIQVKNERGEHSGYIQDIKGEVDENINSSVPKTHQSIVDLMKSPMKNESAMTKSFKTGQLGLFFRKVYSLASLRLRDLYKGLQITSEDIQHKIWTCLEHALSVHTTLMADHHLDQIIMCSIFCICKLNKCDDRDIPFQDIIKFYRMQPQAVSHVYRTVLLTTRKVSESSLQGQGVSNGDQDRSIQNSQPLTVKNENGHNTSEDKNGSIIEFYNKVFIRTLTDAYILRFSPSEKNSPPLSPMPRNKFSSPNMHSPLRRVSNYPVYISPLRAPSYPSSPNRSKSYRFQSNLNSSNDLKAINNMMKSNANIPGNGGNNDMKAKIATAFMMNSNASVNRVSKRILQDDQESDSSQSHKMLCLNRKIRDIVSDRQILSGSSSANASATDDSNDSIQFNSQPSIGINLGSVSMSPMSSHNHESFISSNYKPPISPHMLVLGVGNRHIEQVNYSNGQSAANLIDVMPGPAINAVVAE